MAAQTPTAAQAQANQGSWGAFLKSIASFNGDLSSLTAPPFILSSTSLTEFSSYWCEHPSIFAAPAKEADPAKRALLVTKWFITTLKQQYASRSEQYGNEKKPLNPFLGELRTINIKQIGHAVLTVPSPEAGKKETYLITLPALHIEGLIFGAPFIELEGTSFITSSTGFTSKIDYSGKGWLSGKKNSVVASVYPTGKEKDVAYNITGVWTKSFEIHQGTAKHNSSKTLLETYDAAEHPTSKLVVAPIDKQHPLESRRAWKGVADGIAKGDMDLVSREKSAIEKAQRDLRAKEKAEGRVWERRYFTDRQGAGDAVLESLGAHVGLPATGDADKTGGLWRYDADKADKVRSQAVLSEADQAKIAEEILGQQKSS
ncbi:oxysterol-binding protein [Colletotrichum tofieldiae]|nr:oxysterol-binding protein [Colletotrichum tofieldiae]GKT72634.1 oxysterol-binding protein [Colletotrichum tofieldiae]GKT89529.1 oxysterol-binding protein [Colletotrichum tofieldiae]